MTILLVAADMRPSAIAQAPKTAEPLQEQVQTEKAAKPGKLTTHLHLAGIATCPAATTAFLHGQGTKQT